MQQEVALLKEYLGALCELKTMGNDLLTTGQIRKIGRDFLEISNAMGSSSLKMFADEVKVIITHKKLSPIVFVGKLYIPTMEFFRVIDVKTAMAEDLRNFFRVNVYLPGSLTTPNIDPESRELISTYEVMMVDLSLGGTYLTAESSIALGAPVIIRVEMDGHFREVEGVIKRKRQLPNGQYGYGCSFGTLNNKIADIVCKYLFKVQKELRV